MIHPIDLLMLQAKKQNTDSNRDAWVGYTLLAAALYAVFKTATPKEIIAGLGETAKPKGIDPRELEQGIKTEHEHTADPAIAKKIALDHLKEDPHYYTHLLEMEAKYRKNPYAVTPFVKRWARENYALGAIKISPIQFLELTTWGRDRLFGGPEWIQTENRQRGVKYQDYNKSIEENLSLYPYLTIDVHTGRVTGHDGRHRAAAAEEAGEEFFAYILPNYESKTVELKEAVMAGKGAAFIPEVLTGQFNDRVRVEIPRDAISRLKTNPIKSPKRGMTIAQLTKLKEEGWYNADTGYEMSAEEGEDYLTRLHARRAERIVDQMTREPRRKKKQKPWSVGFDPDEEKNPQPYHGEHSAPDRESGAPLYDVTLNGIYPADFYSANGFRYYADFGESRDRSNYSGVVAYHKRPRARVKIYRAVPKSLPRSSKTINKGDWVTISRAYAVEHGKNALNGEYSIVSKVVRAADIYTAGDSIYEWGYDPQPLHVKTLPSVESNPVPPASVAKEAREALELRASVAPSKRGGTSVGLARAKQLANRQNISDKTMRRMKSYFARHSVDKRAKGFRKGEKGYPSKGLQAWKLWGGDSALKWLKKYD